MNKGEWSEIYTFLKILADGKIDSADARLNVIPGQALKIKNILRARSNVAETVTYEILSESGIVRYCLSGDIEAKVSVKDFNNIAEKFLAFIVMRDGSFEIDDSEILKFLDKLGSPKNKEKSNSKKDIELTAVDMRSGLDEVKLGFSIKSKLGGDSTLFNASKNSTNFLYNLVIPKALDFKSLKSQLQEMSIQKRMKELEKHSISLKFHAVVSETFNKNLSLIDTQMGQIMGNLVRLYYTSEESRIDKLTLLINNEDPLSVREQGKILYQHKIKEFLKASALGMTAARSWDGMVDATGGYIVVKEDGHLVCYHIYNMNEFSKYVYVNTYLDTPSTSRHDHGVFYQENGEWFVKLNLQIRFK
jgi:hypothetical protein